MSAFQRASESYAESGDTDTAVGLLQQCAEEFPRTKGVWRKLAELHRLSVPPDLQGAAYCLRKEEEVDPNFGEDPIVSIALYFAETAGKDLGDALGIYADSHPCVSQVLSRVISRHFSQFSSLDERTRKEWVGAAHMIWCGDQMYEENRSRAAGHFSAIVERELRRLFDDFRREKRSLVLTGASAERKRDDPFLKYLAGGHIELGTMISEINKCKHSAHSRCSVLERWLIDNASLLWKKWDGERGVRLAKLRNPSSHGGALSESQIEDLYDCSVWLISLLPSKKAPGPPMRIDVPRSKS